MDKKEIRALEDIHAVNMKLLYEVDRVCKKYGIRYYLDSGTLLGAVRNKGFIPWDDDIDLVLERSEYDKLLAVADEFQGNFEFIRPDGHHFFLDCISRIAYKHSQLHTPCEEDHYYNDYYNRLFVDLFPLDHFGGGFRGKLQIFKLKMLYGMAMSRRHSINYSKYGFAEKLTVAVLATFGKLFSLERIMRRYEKIAIRYNNRPAEFLLSSHYPLPDIGRLFPAKAFEKSDIVTINDANFPAPAGWDDVLTQLYGDYMSLPPVEQRVPQHANLKEAAIW